MAFGLLLALALVFAYTATSATGASHSTKGLSAGERAVRYYSAEIRRFRTETWYWQRLMGVRLTHLQSGRLALTTVGRLRRLDTLWQQRLRKAHRKAKRPPHLGAWLCIHRYEGGWSDAGAPYYGGLQMDISFQSAYGRWLLARKGTADRWTPLEQIWTAEKALRSRGFYPWPNSARACGLLY
jgi:hypothetical protein